MKNKSYAAKRCYQAQRLSGWVFYLILFLLPAWMWSQPQIITTIIPDQLYKPSGGSTFTYCVTIIGNGLGDDWSLGTGFYMTLLTTDGMAITSENANSCMIEYTPAAAGPGNGNLEIIYTNTGTGLNDVLIVPIVINASGTPAALSASSTNLGTNLSPGVSSSVSFILSGGNTEYTASTGAAGWSVTQNTIDRSEFTLSGTAPAAPGNFTVSVNFTPLCGGTATSISFTGTVIAVTTDVNISISGSITLPPAMINKNYPAPGATLPTLTASGGINGSAGGNSHNWAISPSITWLNVAPVNSVAEGTTVNFSPTGSVTGSPVTLNFNVTAADAAAGSTSAPDSENFSLEILPELTLSASSVIYTGAVGDAIPAGGILISTITPSGLTGSPANREIVAETSPGVFTVVTSSWLQLENVGNNTRLRRIGDPVNAMGNPVGDDVTYRIRYTDSNGYTAVSSPIHLVINRRPVDIVFVLDRSGSMGWKAVNSASVNYSRWYYLEEGMNALFDLIDDDPGNTNDFALTNNDRVGIVLFNSSISEALTSPLVNYSNDLTTTITTALSTININDIGSPPDTDFSTDPVAAARDTRGTGLGAGIASAVARLCQSCLIGGNTSCGGANGPCGGRTKVIILFTDGEQNENPRLVTSSTSARIENLTASQEPHTTNIPTVINNLITQIGLPIAFNLNEFGNGNYKIFTIALAGNANLNTINDLAQVSQMTDAAHDATYSHLNGTGDFTGFSSSFLNTLVSAMEGGSPQIVDSRNRRLPAGGTGEEIFQINDRVSQLSFMVISDPERMKRFQIRVFKGSREFSLTNPASFTEVSRGQTYTIFTVAFRDASGAQTVDPAGEWRVQVQGQANDYYEVTSLVDEHFLDYECYLQEPAVVAGNNLTFISKIDYAGAPVADLKVTAQILGPDEDLPTLISNAPTPPAIRPWLQSDYTWNLELYNKLDIAYKGTIPDKEFTITGRATDAKGKAISGALVSLAGKNVNSTTNEKGEYSLSNVRIGDRMTLSKEGNVLKDIAISSAVLFSGKLLVDFLVGATPNTVDSTLANIISLEPGITPAEAKVEYLNRTGFFASKIILHPNIYRLLYRGDGKYSIPYPVNKITGSQKVLYRIEGEIPGVGKIQRHTFNSAVVKFGLLDITKSGMVFTIDNKADGMVYGHFEMKPVDQFGNLLGINRGYNIGISASNNSTFKLGPFVDRLDGSYLFPASYSEGVGIPQVKIVVDDQTIPLYEGSIEKIPGGEEDKKFKLPFALGVALPVGDFANLYDPGIMAELKLGIPLTKNKKLNLNVEGGFYSFDQRPQTEAFQIWGGAIGLRYDLAKVLGGDVFIDLNPIGYYKPTTADGAYGLNAGAGIFWKVFTPQLSLGLEGSYYYLNADPDPITFIGLGVGFRINIIK